MTTAAGTVRILTVENDVITAESLTSLLRQRGYEAYQAGTAERALDLMSVHRPDAVVCDVYLPGMDGLALVRAVRGRSAWREVPVVLITAAADDAVREMLDELEDLRPAALLRKPFEFSSLLDTLEALLSRGGG